MTKYLLMGTSSNFGNMFSMAGASVFLPFLPMLPTQVLLNNLLYDLAQITIPTDNVDPEVIAEAAALGHPHDSQLHADHRAHQLALRLSDLLRPPARLSRGRGALSHRLVRRVARDADARALRHPHAEKPADEPTEPAARDHDASPSSSSASSCRIRRSPACSASCRSPPLISCFSRVATLTYLALVQVAKRYLLGSARVSGHHVPIAP